MNAIEATNQSIQMLMQRAKDVRENKDADINRLKLEVTIYGRLADHVRNAIQICKMIDRPKDLALTIQ